MNFHQKYKIGGNEFVYLCGLVLNYVLLIIKNTIFGSRSFLIKTNLMAKKKNYLILFLIFMSVFAYSQKPRVKNDPAHDDKPVHFGFSLGINHMNFQVQQSEFAKENNYYVGVNELKPGINIQAIANLRMGEYFDLRCLPGISFGERQLYFLDQNDSMLYEGKPYQMESSFLELPIAIKYKAKRLNNFRPYLIGGVNVRYDLAVKKEYDQKEQLIMLAPFDFYTEVGGGFDFYLTYFKFGIELKYSLGMTNVFRSTNPAGDPPSDFPVYTDMIDHLRSSIFQISFHFE